MFFYVYKTTCLVNGKFYIGKHKTKNLNDGYLGSGSLLLADIAKYGRREFVIEIIDMFDTEERMNLAEKILVVPDRETSYNLTKGGYGSFSYINKYIITPEKVKYWGSLTSGTKGKRFKKQPGVQSGSKNSQFGSIWITNGSENRKIKGLDLPEGWRRGRVI